MMQYGTQMPPPGDDLGGGAPPHQMPQGQPPQEMAPPSTPIPPDMPDMAGVMMGGGKQGGGMGELLPMLLQALLKQQGQGGAPEAGPIPIKRELNPGLAGPPSASMNRPVF